MLGRAPVRNSARPHRDLGGDVEPGGRPGRRSAAAGRSVGDRDRRRGPAAASAAGRITWCRAVVDRPGRRSAATRAGRRRRRAPRRRASRVEVHRSAAPPAGCCSRRGGVELVEEPHPLLRERQRDPVGTRAAASAGRPRRCRVVAPTRSASAGDGRAPRTARARRSSVPSAAPSRATTRVATQRVAAEVEEVVVDADPVDAEDVGEDVGDGLARPACVGARNSVACRAELRLGQRLPVELADRGQRDLVEHDDRCAAPCARAAGRPGARVRRGGVDRSAAPSGARTTTSTVSPDGPGVPRVTAKSDARDAR